LLGGERNKQGEAGREKKSNENTAEAQTRGASPGRV